MKLVSSLSFVAVLLIYCGLTTSTQECTFYRYTCKDIVPSCPPNSKHSTTCNNFKNNCAFGLYKCSKSSPVKITKANRCEGTGLKSAVESCSDTSTGGELQNKYGYGQEDVNSIVGVGYQLDNK